MRSSSFFLWILAALLIVATVDTRPDPPAVNPGNGSCKVLKSDDRSDPAETLPNIALIAIQPLALIPFLAESGESPRPVDQIVLTGQPADSSPPVSA